MALVLLLAPLAQGAPVKLPRSGWYWADPQPQGASLADVRFSGTLVFAAGSRGTILRSGDGGRSWTALDTAVSADLEHLSAPSPGTLIAAGLCTLLRSDDGGESFRRILVPGCADGAQRSIEAIDFPTSDTGFVLLSDGTVLTTAGRGGGLTPASAVPGTRAAGAAQATATAVDVAIRPEGGGLAIAREADGPTMVYRTRDGARSWSLAITSEDPVEDVELPTASRWYAAGRGLLRSDDGGSTWNEAPLAGAPRGGVAAVRCSGPLRCLLLSGSRPPLSGGRLLVTTDGGNSAAAPVPPFPPSAIALDEAGRSVAVGPRGRIAVSSDGGLHFARVGSELPGIFERLRRGGAGTVWALGRAGRLAHTSDGGLSWTPHELPLRHEVSDASFPTRRIGFVTAAGALLRTGDGGRSWKVLIRRPRRERHRSADSILALDRRRLIVAGRRGLLRSEDGGRSFRRVRSDAVRRSAFWGLDRAGRAVVAFGERRLVISTDGGRRWRKLRPPRRQVPGLRRHARISMDVLDFVDARRGFVFDTLDGDGYSTTDGGRHWSRVWVPDENIVQAISFVDARNGFVALNRPESDPGAGLFRTSDGGRSWRPQNVRAGDVAALSRFGAVALLPAYRTIEETEVSELFATSSGGDHGAPAHLTLRASRRNLPRPGRVRLTGRLSPAAGGETVALVSCRLYCHRFAALPVSSDGSFEVTRRVRRSTVFSAVFDGATGSTAAGAQPVRVSVRPGRPR